MTFDIMMTNTQPVAGFQFDFLSGNGVYDGDDDCRCQWGRIIHSALMGWMIM